MAFYNARQDDEDDAPDSGTGIQTGPQAGMIGNAGPLGDVKPNTPDKGSNFAGLNEYLKANQSQASKLGDQTANVINQSAQDARSGVDALNQEATQKIKGQGSLSQEVSDKLKNSAETLSDAEKNQIKQTQTATYKGPQDVTKLSSYQDAAGKVQKANQNLQGAGTEEGRMGLISQVNSKPRTQGMNVFDNALLQAGGGREKLQSAATANQDIPESLNIAAENIKGQIGRADDPSTPDVDESTGAIGQTNKAQADAYKQVQDALSAWKSGFQPKVGKAQQDFVDLQNRVTGDLGDNQFGLDQETMDLFGLQDGQGIYGLNLSDYLNAPAVGEITAANVATPEDYARYGALADLAGETNLTLDPKNSSKAGTAPVFGADRARLGQDILAAGQTYQNAYDSSRGGVLNSSFLNASDELGTGFTNLSELQNATPKELEQKWLPFFESKFAQNGNPAYRTVIDALKGSIDGWKKDQKATNVVKRNA